MLYYSLLSLLMEIVKEKEKEGYFSIIKFCMLCLFGKESLEL
jgi:hypothetical protein